MLLYGSLFAFAIGTIFDKNLRNLKNHVTVIFLSPPDTTPKAPTIVQKLLNIGLKGTYKITHYLFSPI